MLRLTISTFFRALIIACSIGVGIVLTLRVVQRPLVERIDRLARENAKWHAWFTAHVQEHDSRLAAIERTVFGASPVSPQTQKPIIVGAQAWQKHRDKELRDRIAALERWRLRVTTDPPPE